MMKAGGGKQKKIYIYYILQQLYLVVNGVCHLSLFII